MRSAPSTIAICRNCESSMLQSYTYSTTLIILTKIYTWHDRQMHRALALRPKRTTRIINAPHTVRRHSSLHICIIYRPRIYGLVQITPHRMRRTESIMNMYRIPVPDLLLWSFRMLRPVLGEIEWI